MIVGSLTASTAIAAQGAVVAVTSRFVVANGSATAVKILPGQSTSMDVRIDAPASQTIGTAFRITQATGPGAAVFTITARSFVGSIYPAGGTPDHCPVVNVPAGCPAVGVGALDGTNPLLDPSNDVNLGRNVADLAVPAAAGTNLLAVNLTLTADGATPLGVYTIAPLQPGTVSTITDDQADDFPMGGLFEITVGQTLSVTKSGAGTGLVSADSGDISCGTVCADIYPGTLVTLTATADPGSIFVGWSGAGCSGTGTCQVTVDAAKTVDANFGVIPTVRVNKVSLGGVGLFSFSGTNGVAAHDITTVTPGVGVLGPVQVLTVAGAATTVTEAAPPAGFALTAINCTGLGAGGTQTPDLGTRSVLLDAAATAAGSTIVCTFTNSKLPTVTITKVSRGDVGQFSFSGTNGVAPHDITTVTPGVGVAGPTQTLSGVGVTAEVVEAVPPAGFVLRSIECTGTGAAGAVGDVPTRTVTLSGVATAAGAAVACTFTNDKLPKLTVTKVSEGGVGQFSFSGNNGIQAHDITTVTPGVGVAGAVQTLATAFVSTTVTEGAPPAGFVLASINCTGLGAGGTQTPNIGTRTVTLDAAATAAGAEIACTFTNAKQSTVTVTKVSEGGVGQFGFTGTNGVGAHSITTVTPGVGVAGPTQTLTTAGASTIITESAPPAGFVLTAINCTGLGAGGNQTPDVGARSVTLDAAATATGAAIACTFTNSKLPTVTVTKISLGGVGQFNYTGTGGVAAHSITTVTPAVPVVGATQTLSAIGGTATVTESVPPAGFELTSISCSGPGSGGAATDVVTRTVTLSGEATAAGAAVACTFSNTKQTTVTVTKVSNGGVGQFGFTGTNGVGAHSITTVTPGVGVAGAVQTVTTEGAATTITEDAPPAGFALTAISCTGLGAGGTATPNLGARSVTLDAAATAPGSTIACTFTNTKLPTVTVTKVSLGGVGQFDFTGSNGVGAHSITTVTSGVGVAGAVQTLTAAGVSTTVTEGAPPAGFTLTAISCTGLGAGGTATPNLGTRTVTLNAAATAAGAAIACTFTNARQPTVTITKVSVGGVGQFAFGGTNGVGAQNITTLTDGVGVAGAVQTLTTAGASTTITEGATASFKLTAISCTGLGAGGTQTPDLVARTVTLDAAATAAGSVIACTFTNTFDDVAPTTTLLTTPPNPSSSGSATFTFGSNEPGTFECSLDGAAFVPCTSPAAFQVGNGTHTFTVRAIDLAGNVDPEPPTYRWTVAAITSIPTLSEWMLVLLALLLGGLGMQAHRRRG